MDQDLTDILRSDRDEIFGRWASAIREVAPETRPLRFDELRDNLPGVLDRIIEAYTGTAVPAEMSAAREHGDLRQREGIDLHTMLLEYHFLRRVIEEVAFERLGRPLDLAELKAIEDVSHRAVETSVLAYAAANEAELQRAGEHKDRLLSALSHDVRTPLNAITLSLTLLELSDRLGPDEREALGTIRAGVSAITDLLRDLLDLTRLESGRMELETASFELDEAIASNVRAVLPLAAAKGLDMVLDLAARARLRTDPVKVRQIIGNLLANAIRYTAKGRITVRSGRSAQGVSVAVEDTGIGIAAEDRERIFDEFYQVGRSHRPSGEGLGLGLAIARRAARFLGGDLSVVSHPAAGSTFTLTLPRSALDEPQAEQLDPSTPPPGPGPGPDAPRVLVVESDAAGRADLAALLARIGWRAEHVLHPDVLDHARRAPPDLCLIDLLQSLAPGPQTVHALRADPRFRDLPIIGVVGHLDPDDRRRLLDAGCRALLEEPLDPDSLRSCWDALKPHP